MFYEQIAEAQNVVIPPAEMAALPEFGEVAKAVNGAIKQTEKNAPGAVERLTKQVGADTMLQNAKRDGAYFAWITAGDTCAYCMMMSAIGWQRAGKNTLRGNHAEHIHAHCDCQYVVDFKGDLKVDGFDPEGLREDILRIADPNGLEYGGDFDLFVNTNGRQAMKANRKGLNAYRNAYRKTGEMSEEEYARAKRLWYTVEELDLDKSEKERVYQEFDNNLTKEEKQSAIVRKAIGNYYYVAVHKGHNQYKIYQRDLIDKPQDIVSEVMMELFGYNWEQYLDE